MSNVINVLDYGYVRLVDRMGNDLSISRAARVSYDADWRAGEDKGSDERLIRYLWRNKHTSPFEAVTFTFEVKAPLFVLRQWHRHRTWSFNEVSGRYTELSEDFYVPAPEVIGHQSPNNKQGRDLEGALTEEALEAARELMINTNTGGFEDYRALLQLGVSRELARTVLPLATYSRMFASVDLLNLLKFITLRLHPHAQWEIQQYARALLDLIRPIVPVAVGAWEAERADGA